MYVGASTSEMSGGPQLGESTDGAGPEMDWLSEPESGRSRRPETGFPGGSGRNVDKVGRPFAVVRKSILPVTQSIDGL